MSSSPWNARLKAVLSDPIVVRSLFWRGIVLFALLAVVKLGILLSLQKHLFHANFRLPGLQPKSLDWLNFGIFEALLLATFFCLGKNAKALPVRGVRLVN